jgi:hypothetical protein
VTAYKQASVTWHRLWKLSGKGVGTFKGAGHCREASQALVSRLIKRERFKTSDLVLIRL